MPGVDQDLVNEMWGGIVDSYDFSIPLHRLELKVKINHGGVLSWFQVVLSDIAYFEFDDSNPVDWYYIELSDVYVDFHGDGQLKVQFVFWLELAILTVICGDMDIQRLEDERPDI